MFVLAYAFLVTYQAYYLLDRIGSAEADVPQQIFLGTLLQSVVVVATSMVGGRLSDRTGRRKVFVLAASVLYGLALFVVALAVDVNGYLIGMAFSGLGFGLYFAVDLALVADVLPDQENAAKDLGVFNIAGALPFSVAPAIAPVVLGLGHASYGVLYAVAGSCALVGAATILPVRGVRLDGEAAVAAPQAVRPAPLSSTSRSTSMIGIRPAVMGAARHRYSVVRVVRTATTTVPPTIRVISHSGAGTGIGAGRAVGANGVPTGGSVVAGADAGRATEATSAPQVASRAPVTGCGPRC
jgi:MFS family permease